MIKEIVANLIMGAQPMRPSQTKQAASHSLANTQTLRPHAEVHGQNKATKLDFLA
jgi:hypothetical protein